MQRVGEGIAPPTASPSPPSRPVLADPDNDTQLVSLCSLESWQHCSCTAYLPQLRTIASARKTQTYLHHHHQHSTPTRPIKPCETSILVAAKRKLRQRITSSVLDGLRGVANKQASIRATRSTTRPEKQRPLKRGFVKALKIVSDCGEETIQTRQAFLPTTTLCGNAGETVETSTATR